MKAVPAGLLCLVTMLLLSPIPVRKWSLEDSSLVSLSVSESTAHNVRNIGEKMISQEENTFQLKDRHLVLLRNDRPIWSSPEEWLVNQAQLADIDGDDSPELVLLVWRPFKPWRVDQYLVNPGRIDTNHNSTNLSCHIIVLHLRQFPIKEKWAGSALVRPVRQILVQDLNQDGRDELISLESTYQTPTILPASTLSIWQWSGFGFSLIQRRTGYYYQLLKSADQTAFYTIP